MSELRHCPVCQRQGAGYDDAAHGHARIYCTWCCFEGPDAPDDAQAADRWNALPVPTEAEADRAARAFYELRGRYVDRPNSREFDDLPPVSKLQLIHDARSILVAAGTEPANG